MGRSIKARGSTAAVRLVRRVLPQNAIVLAWVGRIHERRKDWRRAEAAYSSGIALGGRSETRFLSRRANVRARQKRWAAAIADCTAHPDIVPPRIVLPRLARHLRSAGQPDIAAARLRSAIDEQPTAELLVAQAESYEDMGRFDAALDAYSGATRIAPDNLNAHTGLGRLQARRSLVPFAMPDPADHRTAEDVHKEALADAIDHLETVIHGSVSRTWAGFWLGRVLESHSMFADASRAYATAVARAEKVDKPWAHNAAQSWRFRRAYVTHRISGEPSDDIRINRTLTIGNPRDDMSGVGGFFEASITNVGLLIEGFVLAEHSGPIEICSDGLPVMTTAGDSNPYLRAFKSTIVHNVLSEFPKESTLTLRVDGAHLVTVSGTESVVIDVPDGVSRLAGLMSSGRTINKKGRWASGPESETDTENQLRAYDKARRFFADELGLDLFVSYGTLLGCYRDGQPIPADDDFDVSFVTSARNPGQLKTEVTAVIKALLRGGFDSRVAVDGRMFHLRVDDVVLDVNPVWFFDGRAWAFEAHALSRNVFSPAKSITVRDVEIYIPAQPEAFLEENYGTDWRIPRSDFQYHRANATRAILRKGFLVPSEVKALQEYADSLPSTLPQPGKFYGYGDPSDPRFT